jgi:cytochrome c biogenesis protein CcdA
MKWAEGVSTRELLEIYQLANRYSFARFAMRVRGPAWMRSAARFWKEAAIGVLFGVVWFICAVSLVTAIVAPIVMFLH